MTAKLSSARERFPDVGFTDVGVTGTDITAASSIGASSTGICIVDAPTAVTQPVGFERASFRHGATFRLAPPSTPAGAMIGSR
ncbi:hypothetical protein CK227_22740 [Mesorhizobium sp. WSM4308]|nr:hypothetical protein CK227_22740 [Mesorhizobium sp. WSM4308]